MNIYCDKIFSAGTEKIPAPIIYPRVLLEGKAHFPQLNLKIVDILIKERSQIFWPRT
jgi:hypothetical protein